MARKSLSSSQRRETDSSTDVEVAHQTVLGAFGSGKSVVFVTAGSRLPATVLEDRGPLGIEGKRVFRIAVFPDDPDQRDEFEVAEDALEPAP